MTGKPDTIMLDVRVLRPSLDHDAIIYGRRLQRQPAIECVYAEKNHCHFAAGDRVAF